MRSSEIFKVGTIVAILSVLWPTMTLGDLSVALYDNFDDGNYDGWTVGDHVSSFPIGGLLVVPSPGGFAVAGGGWPSGHGIWHPLNTVNSPELSFAMRATSGGNIDCSLIVWNEFEYPKGNYYQGISYQRRALFAFRDEDGVEHVFTCASGLSGWHDFKWARDAQGWWSFYLDGQNVCANFVQESRLTSFISVDIGTPNAQVEWVRVSAVPVPGAALLGAIGLGFANYLLRRRSAL